MSIAFDRAATIYDQTRLLYAPMADRGLPLIAELAQGRRILEVGVGTGRLCAPLIEQGARMVGIDLSRPMMARLREKKAEAALGQADATRLPFASGKFQVVLTAHVMHLISGWQNALAEFRRVLKPNGLYISAWALDSDDAFYPQMRRYWRERVEAYGIRWQRPGVQSREELLDALTQMGAQIETVALGEVPGHYTGHELIGFLENRVFSDTWQIPDDVLATTIAELREWAAATYADALHTPSGSVQQVLDVVQFKRDE